MDNENLVYWQGKPVGIEVDRRIHWFPSAPREVIKRLGRK